MHDEGDMMHRDSYAIIDGEILKNNVKAIVKTYSNYEYYIGVVKNNAYHHGIYSVKELIAGGINYLAVSSLDEAIMVRKYYKNIPILCLEVIPLKWLDDVIKYNITITVDCLSYLKKLLTLSGSSVIKVHLAVDTGMHRLGFDNKKELTEAFYDLKNSKSFYLEGIFTHFATSGVQDPYYDRQVNRFLKLTQDIYLEEIPIVHLGRSLTMVQHEKLNFCNGIRVGIAMYGFNQSRVLNINLKGKYNLWKMRKKQKKYQCSPTKLENSLNVKPAFALYSKIMSRRKIKINDFAGYNASYIAKKDGYIYTLPIGFADGVDKSFGYVLIGNEKCKIVADCMDMILIFSQNKYEIGKEVEIFGKKRSILEVCRFLDQNAYHLLNQISFRVARIHKNNKEEKEILY